MEINHILVATMASLVLASIRVDAAIDAAQFAEPTDSAGNPVIRDTGETWGSACGDLNGDGAPDLWMTKHQYHPTALLQGNPDGTFTNVVATAVINATAHFADDTHSAAWTDIEGDGDDDLLEAVEGGANVLTKPIIRETWRNNLFVNDEGILTEQARAHGLDDPRTTSRTPLWLDFDRDGSLDLVMAAFNRTSRIFRQTGAIFEQVNDLTQFGPSTCEYAMASHLGPNGEQTLICGGQKRIETIYNIDSVPFTDLRTAIGNDLYTAGFSDIAIGDFDGDLRLDLFGGVTSMRGVSMAVRTGLANERIQAEFLKGAAEQGFSFTATGEVAFEFGHRTDRSQIHLGAKAIVPPAGSDPGVVRPDSLPHHVQFTLSPSDPNHSGLASARKSGVYIGFDSTAGRWDVRVLNSTGYAIDAVVHGTNLSAPEAVGPLKADQGTVSAPVLFLGSGSGLLRRPQTETYPDCAGSDVSTLARSLVAGDFDNDMDLDLFVAGGGNVASAPNLLLENDSFGHFKPVSNTGGATANLLGKMDTVTTADYDQDGFIDLFIANGGFPAPFCNSGVQQLFRNQGNGNHWIEVDLVGTESNRHGIGARVHARTPDGKTQLREQTNGEHRGSQDYRRLHIGLGANLSVDLDVSWPSGRQETFPGLSVDAIHQLVEGSGGDSAPDAPETDRAKGA